MTLHDEHDHHAHHADPPNIVRDPVCGMTVDPDAAKPTLNYLGRAYHFCSESCRA